MTWQTVRSKAKSILRPCAVVFLISGITGCASDCPFEKGSRVKSVSSGKTGVIMDIGGASMSSSCNVVVMHDDHSFSRSQSHSGDGDYDESIEYVRAWKYTGVEK